MQVTPPVDEPTSIPVLCMPWVFSQSYPMSTAELISEATKRGVHLNPPTLRELYRRGDLAPLVEITARKVREPVEVPDFPPARGSVTLELRLALPAGRVRDPAMEPFRPRTRFDGRKISDPPGWQNNLLYGKWQLLALPDVRRRLGQRRWTGSSYHRRRAVLPELDAAGQRRTAEHRRWALVLTALEARYVPAIKPEWLRVVNVEPSQWYQYRAQFDPVGIAAALGMTVAELRSYAERLLSRAQTLDPTGRWSRLIRRAPPEAWESLSGDALLALDHRLAAEILLAFYEDLVDLGEAEQLPDLESINGWHPLVERLTAGQDIPLDEILGDLGVSPHARLVLAIEGETEELLVPRVFDELGLRRTPDLLRILCMRGADKDLDLVAALAVAPLVGALLIDAYDLVRPPARLMIAVDQDQNWDTDAKIEKRRNRVIAEIERVVAAQGRKLDRGDLDELVHVRCWPAKCFEYAHFTDEELADVLIEVHHDRDGLGRDELVALIADHRRKGDDIKRVWKSWNPGVAKPDFAEALWPVLQRKIKAVLGGLSRDIPPVAKVVQEAYELAQQFSLGRRVIRAQTMGQNPRTSTGPDG